jgi:FRG domain
MASRIPTFDGWASHDWGIEVKSSRQALDLISHIALLAGDRTYAWRGQSDASWRLTSSLFRRLDAGGDPIDESALRTEELSILKEARRWGLGRDLGASATDLHLLAILQHHGLPTRFLDVTSNPMTALWFAIEEQVNHGQSGSESAGVMFAFDVTNTDYFQTFQHDGTNTWAAVGNFSAAVLELALEHSAKRRKSESSIFRAFPALPDERMRAQEGYFLGSAFPKTHRIPGVIGLNLAGKPPGDAQLKKLLESARGPGRPASLPFCAIIIPPKVKQSLRGPLRRTYNRRRRVLFPDIDGFRTAFDRGDLTS